MEEVFPTIDKERTAKNLRRIMETQGMGAKELQRLLHLGCVQSVYHWLEGKSLPTIDNLYAISVYLNVSIDEIVYGNYSKKAGTEMRSPLQNGYTRYKAA